MSNDPKEINSRYQYFDRFSLYANDPTQEKILERALDIRKFEIDLYWKRTGYFWGLIAALFAGKVGFLSDKDPKYIFLVSCIGLILSLSWYLANRGSKYWQENWERHVDALEDEIIGPLYKTTLSSRYKKHHLLKSYPFSVSKINQIISLYITFIWTGLFLHDFLNALFSQEILKGLHDAVFKPELNQLLLTLLMFIWIFFPLILVIFKLLIIMFDKSFEEQSKDAEEKDLPCQNMPEIVQKHEPFLMCIWSLWISTIFIYMAIYFQDIILQFQPWFPLVTLIFLFLGTIFCSIYLIFGTGGTSQKANERKLEFRLPK
jgi:hypothetical protein